MAQPSPPVASNGVPSPAAIPVALDSVDASDSAHSTIPVKRKREVGETVNEDTEMQMDVDVEESSIQDMKDPPRRIHDFFDVISSFDPNPSILKRKLPETDADNEPDAKRVKSTGAPMAATITDRVARGQYALLDDVANDLVTAVEAQLADLASNPPEGQKNSAQAISDVTEFRDKALDIFRREMIYPRTAFDPQQKISGDAQHSSTVLSFFSNALQGRQLYSALPLSPASGVPEPLPEVDLPPGVLSTRLLPNRQPERCYTIGDLFGPPRLLPPLQHQSKPQSKGTTVAFYHPELTEKSKYRSNTYFSQKVSVGHYLDYSNAASISKSSKQRERAQSLAGRKPSSSEQEAAELDTLFRGAFSSFAPSKDDSGAMVPANQAAQIYWHQTGHRNFDRMIEKLTEQEDQVAEPRVAELEDIDEKLLEEAFEEKLDPSLIDPALESILGEPKPAEEKEADELLDEVTDLIETVLSFQRIRLSSSGATQNRYAGEPGGGDLLSAQLASPSEEEVATYEALKAQLILIMGSLPPHAVARLNGDQLEELSVSTKIEVFTATSKGVMEDEASVQARARQQQTAAVASAPRPTGHRTPSAPSYGNQYGANQYGTPTRQPMAQQNFYRPPAQTPLQQQPHGMARPAAPHSMPHQQHRPQPNQAYRPPNGYPNHYASQVAKAQTPYGHQQMPQYGQQRPQQFPYGGTPQHSSPSTRYQPTYPQGYTPQQQQQQQQQQPGTPGHGNYGNYTNGAGNLQSRTASPHVPYSPSPPVPQQQQGPHYPPRQGSQPQHQPQMPQQHYQQQHYQQPQNQQQQHFRPNHQAMPGAQIQHQQYANGMPQQAPSPHGQAGIGGPIGGHQDQNQRMLEQARARAAAQQNSAAFGDKISQQGGNVSGLGGIGLGGNFNAAQYAAQQTRMTGGAGSPVNASPRPPSTGPNGTPGMPRVSPIPPPTHPHHQQPHQQQGS